MLKAWVDRNIEDPYPSVAEKNELAQETGLTLKQINDWFTNFRKRHWEEEMMDHRCGRKDLSPQRKVKRSTEDRL